MANQTTQVSKEHLSFPADFHPPHEAIAALAYALWQERDCPEGNGELDWLKAEQELIASRHAAVKALTP